MGYYIYHTCIPQYYIYHTYIPQYYIYHTLKYKIIPNTKYFTYQQPNNLNSHNSVICQARSLKFCMIIDLDNTNKLYHTKSYHRYTKIPSHTKYQIFQTVIIQSFFKLGVQNFLF